MALIQKCLCGNNQSTGKKVCRKCNADLVALRKAGKIRFYAVTKINGKAVWEFVGTSFQEAKDTEGKRRGQKRENRILDIQADGTKTFKELADWYIGLSDRKEIQTYERMKTIIGTHVLKAFGAMQARELKQQNLIDYRVSRKNEKACAGTVQKEVIYFKAIIRRAVVNGLIPATTLMAFDGIKPMVKKNQTMRKLVISVEEFQALLSHAPSEKYMAVFTIYFHTGLRKSELLKLRWRDVDLEKGWIHLPAEITKTGESRSVPLNEYSKAAFQSLRKERKVPCIDGSDHVVTHRGQPIRRGNWGDKALSKACERAGLSFGANSNGIGFHTFRHSFVSHMEQDAWVPVSICAAIVGHQLGELGAHAVYQHPTAENLQRAMEKFTEWFDGKVSSENKFDDSLTKSDFPAIVTA
jgi:integrase